MLTVRELRHALYVGGVYQNRPVYVEVSGEKYVVEEVKQDSFGDVVLVARKVKLESAT